MQPEYLAGTSNFSKQSEVAHLEDKNITEIRIAHLSVVKRLTSGQTAQLEAEHALADTISGVTWATFALQDVDAHVPFAKRVAWPLRGSPLRNFQAWLEILRLSRHFDYVLVRQMPVDVFAPFFAPFVRNRVSVHHSKEVEEHTLISNTPKRRLAAWLDRRLIRISVRSAVATMGVTLDIATYEQVTYHPHQSISVYPNLVGDDSIGAVGDRRDPARISAIFICGTFTEWHGLDRLIEAIKKDPDGASKLQIHLVGVLSEEQVKEISQDPVLARVFEIHGYLKRDIYRVLLEEVHVGIGSLALDRQNMTEGSSLKTAELLGSGIPVYATHRYPTVPDDFAFFRNMQRVEISDILEFAAHTARYTRHEIVAASVPYICKRKGMLAAADFLRSLPDHR
jgi:glycosyltransferase involved in cell wall biosynthesis